MTAFVHPHGDVIVVMGVSGSGKSTIASALATCLGGHYLDADDLHPQHNIDKMSSGVPLTDADRLPWLERIRGELDAVVVAGESAVLACSALKKTYRDILRTGPGQMRFVYLRADRAHLLDRVGGRNGHFFPAALLDSQFATLEEPDGGEAPIVVAASEPPDALVARIRSEIAR